MLVRRTEEGKILWMSMTDYLFGVSGSLPRAIEFTGTPMTALSLQRLRDRYLPNLGPNDNALDYWQQRLEYLQKEDATAYDSLHKFALMKQIEETKARVAELSL